MHAALDCAPLDSFHESGDLAALHPSQAEHERHCELAERRGRVDAEVDAAISPPASWISSTIFSASASRRGRTGRGERRPVPPVLPARMRARAFIEPGPLELAAGLVEVGVPLRDLDAPQLRPLLDLVPLDLRADEQLGFSPGDPTTLM